MFSAGIFAAISSVVASIFEAMPKEWWYVLLGIVIGAAVSLYGAAAWLSGDYVPREVPTVAKKEAVTPEKRQADPWASLDIYEPPPDTTVVRDTVLVPESVAERPPSNGLPAARYDPELLSRPELTDPILFGVVPFQDGQRPDISVGPNKVNLRIVNPSTAGFMSYTYRVPNPTWSMTASASLEYSRDPADGHKIAPSLSIEVSRKIGSYTVVGAGLITTGESWWSVGLGVEKTLWTTYD